MHENTYALITPAYNEDKHIIHTINSVLSQTIMPIKWVIINDGSTDRTDEIITQNVKGHDFIHYLRLDRDKSSRNFASKVHAFNYGYKLLKEIPYSFIGNLDADVSFEPHFYECLLNKFKTNPQIGIAGGYIYEKNNGTFQCSRTNSPSDVSGAAQLFRRECFDAIGGYLPFEAGGEDTCAVVMACMKGYHVEAFPELKVFHYKLRSAGGYLRESFLSGSEGYALGSHPLFEILKSFHRITCKPYIVYTFVRIFGYLWQYVRRQERPVSTEFIRYVRREQMNRIKRSLIS